MQAQATRKQHAKFWQYTGNHMDGRDCERSNPYGYPLSLVSWMAYRSQIDAGVNAEITYGESGNFGREVSVAATREAWEQAWIQLAKESGENLASDWGISGVRKEDGWCNWLDASFWLYSSSDELICEVFRRPADETQLESVKKGFGILILKGEEYLFEDTSLASTK